MPWLVANLVFLHRLLPPTSGLAFLQSYEQLFAYGNHPGLHDLFRHGFGSAVRARRHALHELWLQVVTAVGHPLMWTAGLLAALNLLGLRQRQPSADQAPRVGLPLLTCIAVSDLLVQAIVLPVVGQGGTWSRSLLAYVPLLFIAALMGARRVKLLPSPRWPGWPEVRSHSPSAQPCRRSCTATTSRVTWSAPTPAHWGAASIGPTSWS